MFVVLCSAALGLLTRSLLWGLFMPNRPPKEDSVEAIVKGLENSDANVAEQAARKAREDKKPPRKSFMLW